MRPAAIFRLNFLLAILFPSFLAGADLVIETSIALSADRDEYQIAVSPIVGGSETITADTLLLVSGRDYRVDYRTGVLRLLKLPGSEYLGVRFILIPPELLTEAYLYRSQTPSDSLLATLQPRKRSLLPDDGKLLITGSKTFALTFSENSAFDLKQSLYVNLDGELAPNVNINAQLSDSQSKLTPEGDSKELSNLDRVFIRVFGTQYEIAMGDLDWKFSGTRYIDYQTSIEGLNAWYRDRHAIQAGYTAASGKTASQRIIVIDGKQGPYFLRPDGFQTSYLVIAGSERIYLDGRLLERGQDYYIDYAEGSVMFRTLVVSANLINAYFQYSDEYYRQGTFFNSSRLEILPGLALEHHFIHQSDARSQPLLYDFSPSDLDSLRQAGDMIAWGTGVVEVEPGQGSYVLRVSDEGLEYYEYAQADTTANYNLTFSFVGTGNGDYEEFSSGKFRYVGSGQGAWLLQKRLIPAVSRSNADVLMRWDLPNLELGLEGIYTDNDRNTFSSLDDADNSSGIVGAYGVWRSGEVGGEDYIRLDLEKRWRDSYLFAQRTSLSRDFDLNPLGVADSLERFQASLDFGTKRWSWWFPELSFLYTDLEGQYIQQALRLISRSGGKGLLPGLDLRSTLARQDYVTEDKPNSLLQYHNLSSRWDFSWLKADLQFNLSSLDYVSPSLLNPGNRYYRVNPSLQIGDPKVSLTQLSFAQDYTAVNPGTWSELSATRTYALKQGTTTLNHTLNFDFTHRSITKTGDNPKSDYNLLTFRNSHYFLNQAVMLLGNYQLNHTEFYPRIRELEYIGVGLGLYDSTGVYTPEGDYDYVYVISDQGTLSAELNAQLNVYLKPGNYFPKLKWLQSDLSLTATEQSLDLGDWRSYFFYPGTVLNDTSTIYGKQSLNQSFWLEILANRILGNSWLQIDRSLDNRYQEQSRASSTLAGAELDLKQYLGGNHNIKYEWDREEDSRYSSEITIQTLGLLTQRTLFANQILSVTLSGSKERGSSQNSAQSYSLSGLSLEPGYRATWGKKGRVSGNLGLRYNWRTGTDFLTFLPEKRGGLLLNWNLSAIYKINSFSSVSFDYSGTSYPDEKLRHNLKLEFKAEL